MALKSLAEAVKSVLQSCRFLLDPIAREAKQSDDMRALQLYRREFWIAFAIQGFFKSLNDVIIHCKSMNRWEWEQLDRMMDKPSRHVLVTLLSRIHSPLADAGPLVSKLRDDFEYENQADLLEEKRIVASICRVWEHADLSSWPELIVELKLRYDQIRFAASLFTGDSNNQPVQDSNLSSLISAPSPALATLPAPPNSDSAETANQADLLTSWRGRLRVLRQDHAQLIELDGTQYSVNTDAYRLFEAMIANHPRDVQGSLLDPPIRPLAVDNYFHECHPRLASRAKRTRGDAVWERKRGRGCWLLIDPNSPAMHRGKTRDA